MNNWIKDLWKAVVRGYSEYKALRFRRNFSDVSSNALGFGHEEYDTNPFKYDRTVAENTVKYYKNNIKN